MRYKIKVEVHSLGEHTEYLIKAIAANNSGLRTISPLDMEAYLRVREAMYHTTTNDLAYWLTDESLTMGISSDKGKTYSLTLEWVEVHELENKTDDLPQALFSGAITEAIGDK